MPPALISRWTGRIAMACCSKSLTDLTASSITAFRVKKGGRDDPLGDQGPRVRQLQLCLRLPVPVQCSSHPRPLSRPRRIRHRGRISSTRLDGLRAAGIFRWPGPIHEGKGEGVHVIDRRATPEQRNALLRILNGEDTEPGATVFQVFASTCNKLHEPIISDIDFELDIAARTARARVDGVLEMRGAPILNPVTGAEHRVRIEQPNGFEFALAEVGRGWSTAREPIAYELADTYGQFARIHLCHTGMVR